MYLVDKTVSHIGSDTRLMCVVTCYGYSKAIDTVERLHRILQHHTDDYWRPLDESRKQKAHSGAIKYARIISAHKSEPLSRRSWPISPCTPTSNYWALLPLTRLTTRHTRRDTVRLNPDIDKQSPIPELVFSKNLHSM